MRIKERGLFMNKTNNRGFSYVEMIIVLAIMAIMVFMANLKLIAIGLCVWGIHLLGFSAIEAILGIFFSQFAVTIMVVLNRKSKEKV